MAATIKEKIIVFFNKIIFFLKKYYCPLIIIFLLLLLSISAILKADFKYADDLGRVVNGYRGWGNFSRYLSNLFSIFLHADTYLTDISPLPQIFAIIIMALASIILIHLFSNGKKITFFNIIAVIPLTINPYFLECLSYKYDAPYMAISVLASIIPFLFYKKSKLLFTITSFLGLLIMCLTYQASSGIFLLLIIFYSLKEYQNKEKIKTILKFIGHSLIIYIISLLCYKIVFMKTVTDYVSNTLFPLLELPLGFFNNLKKYYDLIISDFKIEWLVVIAILIIGFFLVSIITSKRNKIETAGIYFISLIVAFILPFGIYPAFTAPIFFPRGMYGFGVLLALILLQISNFKHGYILKIMTFILCYCFFSFSFTYGNALQEQKDYTEYRMYLVASDLNNLEIMNNHQLKQVKIVGNIGKAPVIQNMPQDYQILNRLIPSTFAGSWIWSEFYFFNYLGLKNVENYEENDILALDLPILKDTMYHEIKGDDTHIIITLK